MSGSTAAAAGLGVHWASLPQYEQKSVEEVFRIYDPEERGELGYMEALRALTTLEVPEDRPRFANLVRQHGTPPPNWKMTAVDPTAPCHPIRMRLSLNQFKRVAAEFLADRTFDDRVNQAFGLFDVSNRGMITAADIMAVCNEIGAPKSEEEAAAMIGMYDATAKGGVDREEFKGLFRSMLEEQMK